MQIGFLDRTPRGRRVTPRAVEHLGLPKQRVQGGLFRDS
jgi:Holliday junction resolvasome RuvABC ATP-dependent DNA helicase subunit